MGLYARGTRLWFSWTDANGKRHREPSDFEVGQEAMAAKVLARGQAKIAAEKKALAGGPRVHTEKTSLTDYVLGAPGGWLEVRRARKPGVAASEQSMFECHISPFLGQMALGEIRPRNARAFIWHMREKISEETGRTFGGRTIRSIAGLLGAILDDAASDEIIPISPYKLKRGDLPPKIDVDPLWRQLAFFEREEIEQLIGDPRIPEDRQVVYALGFMTGMRPGEVAALRWERYLANEQPLGKLVVATSFCAKTHKERPTTKTSSTKLVPVHASLASILAKWKLGGWARLMGTDPRPRDLLVPSRRRGDFRNPNDMTNSLEVDLDALGLRRRTARDWRPSFMTLVRADGAIDEIARMITHGGQKDTVGGYLRFPWATVCRELAKLRIELRGEGLVLPFRQAVGGDGVTMEDGVSMPAERPGISDISHAGESEALAQRCHSPEKQPCLQLPGEVHGLSRNQSAGVGPGRLTPANAAESQSVAARQSASSGLAPTPVVTMCQSGGRTKPAVEPVVDPVADPWDEAATRFVAAVAAARDPVGEALLAAQDAWSGARDRIGLRVRLLEIDRLLDRMALAERPLPPGGKP